MKIASQGGEKGEEKKEEGEGLSSRR